MKYSFKKNGDWIIVETEEDYDALASLTNTNWNVDKVREIVNGIIKTIDTDEEYKWASEDLLIISNRHSVFFIDLLLSRGKNVQVHEKQDLDLSHDDFLNFLSNFEKFILENA